MIRAIVLNPCLCGGHRCVRALRWAVVAFALSCSSIASAQPRSDGGGPAGPVATDSPAWLDLMAQPIVERDSMNYHAAALAARWGRSAEATTLRDHLLARHGRALAEGPPSGVLGDLVAQPAPTREAIQAAWNAGLQQAWGEIQWQAQPPVLGLPDGAVALSAHPGFWRLPGGGLGAHAAVRNRARMAILLPGSLHLELQADNAKLLLACTRVAGSGRWLQDESARWWCSSPATVPEARLQALAAATPQWRITMPGEAAAWDGWAAQLAGSVPTGVNLLISRRSHCRDQFNCREGRLPTSEERAAQRSEEFARKREQQRIKDAESDRREARKRRAEGLWLIATLVGAFGVYALVARAAGTAVATGISLLLVIATTLWLFAELRHADGWGAWGLLFLALVTPVYGAVVAFGFRWLYRRFFAPQ